MRRIPFLFGLLVLIFLVTVLVGCEDSSGSSSTDGDSPAVDGDKEGVSEQENEINPEAEQEVLPEEETDAVDNPAETENADEAGETLPEEEADMPAESEPEAEEPAEIEQETEPVCTCHGVEECCDGCYPTNEGQNCGAPDKCTIAGFCVQGRCEGAAPVECNNPPSACHESGVCNPGNGQCSYEPKPEGAECEAVAGKPGSGLCDNGTCKNFGACDHRAYGQPTASPCNFDGECAGGLCLSLGDEWNTYCSQRCGEAGQAECPVGTSCVISQELGYKICKIINKSHLLPGDGSLDAFHVCNSNEDCAGALCLSTDGKKFCTKNCEVAGIGSDLMCGSCGSCRDNGDTLDFPYKYYCVPKGSNGMGGVCAGAGDCTSRYCLDGYCSGQCWVVGGISTCPAGMVCIAGIAEGSPTTTVCVANEDLHKNLGQTCKGDWACDVGKCVEYDGEMRCLTECQEDSTCTQGVCVTYSGSFSSYNYCVPQDWVGFAAEGEYCKFAYQCLTGLGCAYGTCLRPCQQDEDCGAGLCYTDMMLQIRYCASPCLSDAQCSDRMYCTDGYCHVSQNGGQYLYGNCRVDQDCETGLCVAGTCSDSCAEAASCEGGEVVEVEPYGMCAPCDPNNYGSDCAPPGGFSLNECLQGADGKYFCAVNCTYQGSEVCPVGTRCYAINGYQSMCAPLSGACGRTAACTSQGVCIRPVGNNTPCSEDVECSSGHCLDGRCQKGTCEADEDCACDILTCDGQGSCSVNTEKLIHEVEPNDILKTAQVLDPTQTRIAASYYPTGTEPDKDLFLAHLKSGQGLDVLTQPFCNQSADTYLRLLKADGTPIEGFENDDIDPQGYYFSVLLGYTAIADEDVIIEVSQSPYVVGAAKVNYILNYRIFTVAENSTCEGAVALSEGTNSYDMGNALNDYAVGSCTGGYPSIGKDMAFSLTVPDNHYLVASINAPFDSQLYLVTDCAAAEETCLAGADASYEAGVENMLFVNKSGADVNGYLIVDSFLITGGTEFDLTVDLAPVEVPENDLAAGAVPILASGTESGVLIGAANDYDPGVDGCVKKALIGKDVVYSVTLDPGWFATFRLTKAIGAVPYMYLVTDPADLTTCVLGGSGALVLQNGESQTTYYLFFDLESAEAYSLFEFEAEFGVAEGCFGPCDPNTYAIQCEEGNKSSALLCYCDSSTSTFRQWDCNASCVDSGALSGTCHTFTTPGYEGDNCLCNYDCAAGFDHCQQKVYTNCTCAHGDPCEWKGNAYCNEFCKIEYPDNYFDDTEDCSK